MILEIDPQYQRDPSDLARIYVSGANNIQVPLTAVTKINRGLSPLVVNHQGQFPSITISFSLDEDVTIQEATQRVDRAVAELHLPARCMPNMPATRAPTGSRSARSRS